MTAAAASSGDTPEEPDRQHALAVLRVAVDVIVPGFGGCPPASALDVHVRVAESLELLQPGSTVLLARLLDMYARAQRDGATFAELDPGARDRALRELADDDLDEIRDLVEGLHAFTLDGYLGGWRVSPANPPAVWLAMGFHGPAADHLALAVSCPQPTEAETTAGKHA